MHNWPGCHVACPEQLSGAEASAGRAVPRAHPGSRHPHPLHPPGSLSDPHGYDYVAGFESASRMQFWIPESQMSVREEIISHFMN
jgi:hypothetical protein